MPLNLIERLRSMLPLTVAGAGLGAASIALATLGLDDEPRLWDQNFRLVRSDDDPFVLRPTNRLSLERQLGDFDLVTTVELPPEADLDVLFRLVQPKADHGDGTLFHARYDALRVTTRSGGAPFLTREALLFEPDRAAGVEVEPGIPATIHLSARGHRVRASVAGKPTGWFESSDQRGSVVFVLRGANDALVRYLDLQPLVRPRRSDPWLWGILAGGLVGLLLGVFGARIKHALGALVALPITAGIGGFLVLGHIVPQGSPTLTGTLAIALAGLPITLARSMHATRRVYVIVVIAVLFVWELTIRLERVRLLPFEDPRVSAVFGPRSGSMTYDILTPQLRSSAAVHKPTGQKPSVVLLGGAGVFDAGGRSAPQHNLGGVLASELGAKQGVVVPTLFSSAAQQLALFELFLVGPFAPDLVVFAITSDEADDYAPFPPRAVLDDGASLPSGFGSELIALLRAAFAVDVPAGTPADLRTTLDRLAALSSQHGFRVALYTPELLSREYESVVRQAAQSNAWPRLRARAGESVLDAAERHADILQPLLGR